MNGCILTCDIDGCNRGSSLEETFGNLPHNPNCHLSLTTFFYVQSPFNLIQPRLIPFNLSVKDLNIYQNIFLHIKVPIILLPSLNLVSPSPDWITDLRYFFPDLHKPDAEQHMRHATSYKTWNKPKQNLRNVLLFKSEFSEQECLQRVPASEDELRPLLKIVTERIENN